MHHNCAKRIITDNLPQAIIVDRMGEGFGLFPLDRSDRLRRKVIQDTVDALDLVRDAVGDVMEQGVGDLFDRCGHGVGR